MHQMCASVIKHYTHMCHMHTTHNICMINVLRRQIWWRACMPVRMRANAHDCSRSRYHTRLTLSPKWTTAPCLSPYQAILQWWWYWWCWLYVWWWWWWCVRWCGFGGIHAGELRQMTCTCIVIAHHDWNVTWLSRPPGGDRYPTRRVCVRLFP